MGKQPARHALFFCARNDLQKDLRRALKRPIVLVPATLRGYELPVYEIGCEEAHCDVSGESPTPSKNPKTRMTGFLVAGLTRAEVRRLEHFSKHYAPVSLKGCTVEVPAAVYAV